MTDLKRHQKQVSIRGVGVLSCQIIEPLTSNSKKSPVTVNVTNAPPWVQDNHSSVSGSSAPMGTLIYALPGRQPHTQLCTVLIEEPQSAELAQRLSRLLVKSIQRPIFLTVSVYGLPSDSFSLDHDLDATGDKFLLHHPQIALIKQVVHFVSTTVNHGL